MLGHENSHVREKNKVVNQSRMIAMPMKMPVWDLRKRIQDKSTQKVSSCCFTSSISHIGVEVAPQIPTLAPGKNQSGFSSAEPEMK